METEILRYIPADIHNHSTLSPDGCDEPMRMAERACGLGIKLGLCRCDSKVTRCVP